MSLSVVALYLDFDKGERVLVRPYTKILTVAGTLYRHPWLAQRSAGSLPRNGSVRPSPQRGGSHIRSRLLRRVCHAAPIWDRFWPKSHAVFHAPTSSRVSVFCQVPRTARCGAWPYPNAFQRYPCAVKPSLNLLKTTYGTPMPPRGICIPITCCPH